MAPAALRSGMACRTCPLWPAAPVGAGFLLRELHVGPAIHSLIKCLRVTSAFLVGSRRPLCGPPRETWAGVFLCSLCRSAYGRLTSAVVDCALWFNPILGIAMLGPHEREALEKRAQELQRQIDIVASSRIDTDLRAQFQVRFCKELAKIKLILRQEPRHLAATE